MRRRLFTSACLVLVFAIPALAQAPKGHLLILGGGDQTDDIVARAVQAAGGAQGKVAVFPQASALADTGRTSVAMWTKAGIGRAVAVDAKDPAAAVAAVRDATFIWFTGGDQTRLMKALANTPIPEAIRRRYDDGALVGGTSAGAAVMSRLMITGDAYDLQAVTAGKTDVAPGLGLWPQALVDQHFLKRQRTNRLLSAVLDRPDLVGIGIDESTAVFVSGGRQFEVLGKSSVVVIDARKAAVDKAAPGDLATGRGLRLSVLKKGMTYDLAED